ncbi:MAG TPA: acetyltransferase [Legionellales bacterium]|mgnify:FL=1|nr:acetyltransferase [Legionellales bacterium]HCA89085.1 acetyltransferase [Legionellales bacterium]|tara:strand:+ start:934 stop:1218 length:285 start_codon:yes stop_codon:yes gene_type:complete
MSELKPKKIIIEGINPQGQLFRPSDWAERMSGSLASFKNNRMVYSPLLQPTTRQDGARCVLLDASLKESSPEIYEAILNFARANHLSICGEDLT